LRRVHDTQKSIMLHTNYAHFFPEYENSAYNSSRKSRCD